MTVLNDMEKKWALTALKLLSFIYKLNLRRKSCNFFFKTLNCESMAGKKN